jgi:exosortase A
MDLRYPLPSAKISRQYEHRSAWRLSIGIAAIGIVTLVGLFWDTAASAVKLWWERPTYNYAFLILPISAYLVWLKRDEVRAATPVGSFWGISVTAAFGLIWFVSDIAEINEGQHLAFVGMILGILLACLGWRTFKILSFPFLYLWLLVPTGTFLLPTLQQIATSISSETLRWFGIPVYTEGFFIEAPSGRYHVEPGCAGLNLILATAALAPLYAYLLFRSLWKRLVAVVLALLLAIITNGLRIAGIIALPYWGGPKFDIVDNHLLFGWALFALILSVAGYAGFFFSDHGESTASISKTKALVFHGNVAHSSQRVVVAGLLSLLTAATLFVLANGAMPDRVSQSVDSSQAPLEVPGWLNVPPSADWSPVFSNADLQIRQSYARAGETADLFLAEYAHQAEGQKMIGNDNRIIDETQWTIVQKRRRMIDFGTKTIPFAELVAASGDERLYVWLFYWVDGTFTANPIVAKLLEVKAKLFFGDQRAVIVAIATPEAAGRGDADRVLQSFMEEALPSLETLLVHAPRLTPVPRVQ